MKIPRFRLQEDIDLVQEIRGLGARDIVTPGEADFGNMVRRNLVHLSSFKHK